MLARIFARWNISWTTIPPRPWCKRLFFGRQVRLLSPSGLRNLNGHPRVIIARTERRSSPSKTNTQHVGAWPDSIFCSSESTSIRRHYAHFSSPRWTPFEHTWRRLQSACAVGNRLIKSLENGHVQCRPDCLVLKGAIQKIVFERFLHPSTNHSIHPNKISGNYVKNKLRSTDETISREGNAVCRADVKTKKFMYNPRSGWVRSNPGWNWDYFPGILSIMVAALKCPGTPRTGRILSKLLLSFPPSIFSVNIIKINCDTNYSGEDY